MTHLRRNGWAWVAAVALCATLAAEAMSVQDLIALKRLDYSEEQIRAEVGRTKSQFRLSAADVKRLKDAGFSDDIIKFLKGTAPEDLTFARVVAMVEGRKTAEEILTAIQKSAARLPLTPAQALELTNKRAPLAVVLALRRKPLGVADVKRLAKTRLSLDGYRTLAGITGLERKPLSPGDALALVQAGVPSEVVKMLREGRVPRARPGGDTLEYRHVGGRFIIRAPREWHVVRSIKMGVVEYGFTPEAGKAKVADVDVGITVGLLPFARSSPVAGKSGPALLKHLLPVVRVGEPGLELVGDVVPAKLGGLAAGRQRLRGKLKDKAGEHVVDAHVALADGFLYVVETSAPAAQYAQYEPTFRKALARSQFGRRIVSRRGPAAPMNELAERYKESVVSVKCYADGKFVGGGTGFIIHKNGYVATNAHVAFRDYLNPLRRRPWPKYGVEWDRPLKRKELPATFVGARFEPGKLPLGSVVDVAVVKLPPGNYRPIPLTCVADLRLGDPIMTMGFPQRFRFDSLDMFVTGGVLTRFNRNREGQVESLYIDAKFAHGSSGGPSISLVTGGVVGLTTFSIPPEFAASPNPELKKLSGMIGYYGVIPTDTLASEFPVIAGRGENPDTAGLDFFDYYDLAMAALARQAHCAGPRMAAKATALRPRSADAHCLRGQCLLLAAATPQQGKAAIEALETALGCEPNHARTLLTLAVVHQQGGDVAKAAAYADRAVQAHPDDYEARYVRAQVYQAIGRHEDALADAAAAKKLSAGIVADPYLLAGQVYYAQGQLDAGKAEFAKAAEVHPTNLDAWLGLGEYYERKGNYAAALAEYGKLEARFPEDPVVAQCQARCSRELRRYDDAIAKVLEATQRFASRHLPPAEELFFILAPILRDVKRKPLSALGSFVECLSLYRDSARAPEAHLACARILLGAGHKGIAHAHLCRALALAPESVELKKELGQVGRDYTSLAEVIVMAKLRYALGVMVDLIEATPLDFALSEKVFVALKKETGLPDQAIGAICQAILNSNNTLGVRKQAGPGPRDPRRPRQPNPHMAALVGVWANPAVRTAGGVAPASVQLTLAADGTFETVMRYISPFRHQGVTNVSAGNYLPDGRSIQFKHNNGVVEQVAYDLRGNQLTLHRVPGLGTIVLTKQAGR